MIYLDAVRLCSDFNTFVSNGFSTRVVAGLTGVQYSKIHRFRTGKMITGADLLVLMYFADLKLSDYIKDTGEEEV